jgi:hypothetical protein
VTWAVTVFANFLFISFAFGDTGEVLLISVDVSGMTTVDESTGVAGTAGTGEETFDSVFFGSDGAGSGSIPSDIFESDPVSIVNEISDGNSFFDGVVFLKKKKLFSWIC